MRTYFKRLALLLFLQQILASCASSPPPTAKIGPIDAGQACLSALVDAKVSYEILPRVEYDDNGCGMETPVRVFGLQTPWNQPGLLSCSMALTLNRFDVEIMQPLALKHFGQNIAKIEHKGTFVCRNQRNRPRLSLHAKGLAIDISGFQLADGSKISILKDWKKPGRNSAFLHELSRSACDLFTVVLTPNSDRDHQDHLHLDTGPYRLCER